MTKIFMLLASLAFAAAFASGAVAADNQGYKSGAGDSGKSGMTSSRPSTTSPTDSTPGTVQNGAPGSSSTAGGGENKPTATGGQPGGAAGRN